MSVLLDAAVMGAKAIAAVMERPDDEFLPVMFVRNDKGESAVVDVQPYLVDDESRELMGRVVLPKLVADMSAQELVLVIPMWYEQVEPDAFDSYVGRPRESDDRIEGLVILSITADGIEARQAAVGRDPLGVEPPTLGEFESGEVVPQEAGYLQGALEALQARAQ